MNVRQFRFFEISIALLLSIVLLTPTISAQGQCNNYLLSSLVQVDRNGRETFTVPIYFENTCDIGGVQFDVYTDPPAVIDPFDIDTTGSRVSYFEILGVQLTDNETLRFRAVADFPDSIDTPPLPPGEGLLVNVIFRFGCSYQTNLTVNVEFDSVVVSDTTGWINYPTTLWPDVVEVGQDVTPDIMRGDANGNHARQSSDVTYLVNYFRGQVWCPISLCNGDANHNGAITSSDVTKLVQFFRNVGTIDPCDE